MRRVFFEREFCKLAGLGAPSILTGVGRALSAPKSGASIGAAFTNRTLKGIHGAPMAIKPPVLPKAVTGMAVPAAPKVSPLQGGKNMGTQLGLQRKTVPAVTTGSTISTGSGTQILPGAR